MSEKKQIRFVKVIRKKVDEKKNARCVCVSNKDTKAAIFTAFIVFSIS